MFTKLRDHRCAASCVLISCAGLLGPRAAGAEELSVELRRPVALQLSPENDFLYVANQRSGSLSIVDVAKSAVLGEVKVGKRLSDLAVVPNQPMLLATDEEAHELVLLSASGNEVAVRQRLKVGSYPVSVTVSSDGRRASVASLWSRRLTFVELPADDEGEAKVSSSLDLPFAPREQLLVQDGRRLLAADAFGSQVAIIDANSRRLLRVRELPVHNIRGMGMSTDGEMLLVSHQMLEASVEATEDNVHWGLMLSNDVRWVHLGLFSEGKKFAKYSHVQPLGETGTGTGDPGQLTSLSDGTIVVALSGVNEIAVGREDVRHYKRTQVGKRPTAVIKSADESRVYVANTFGDSVSVVELPSRKTTEISLGPQPKLTLAEQGELLFFDARLSHDRWMSCNSCHTDGHTNGKLNDNLSDGGFGAPKRVLSLLGRAGTEPFAWNATAKDFDDQIRKSITNTMQSDEEPKDSDVAALAAFLKTLAPPPPIDLARGERDEAAVERGSKLFQQRNCAKCHAPSNYTSADVYDVGLKDEAGNDRFNPPSLLGVGQRGHYFHDGRAKSLEDVFQEHRHQVDDTFGGDDLRDLAAFLRSL